MTWQNLIIGILGALLAAGIVAMFSRLILSNSRVRQGIENRFRKSLGDRFTHDPKQALRSVMRWLRRDQDKYGAHIGQFGSGANLNEERLFQTSREKLEAKPRLYLTG